MEFFGKSIFIVNQLLWQRYKPITPVVNKEAFLKIKSNLPGAMKLIMPNDTPVKIPATASEEKTLTFLVAKDNRLFYYPGIFKGGVKEINFKELRNVIINKKQQVFKKFGSSSIVYLLKLQMKQLLKTLLTR